MASVDGGEEVGVGRRAEGEASERKEEEGDASKGGRRRVLEVGVATNGGIPCSTTDAFGAKGCHAVVAAHLRSRGRVCVCLSLLKLKGGVYCC